MPAPTLKDLLCPVTRQPMRPGFVERREVLARRAPEFYVRPTDNAAGAMC